MSILTFFSQNKIFTIVSNFKKIVSNLMIVLGKNCQHSNKKKKIKIIKLLYIIQASSKKINDLKKKNHFFNRKNCLNELMDDHRQLATSQN
jgi:hypothetical protein